MLHWNFSEPKNPRFIIESGFKSRAGNNGARTVVKSPETTLCNPVVPVGGLLYALQKYSAVNCFKNSFAKLILCLKA